MTVTATQDPKASQNRKWRRRRRSRRDRRFAEMWRRAMEAPPLTEAEKDAYYASEGYARDQRDALVASWWHRRDQMLARNPAPMTTAGIGISAPRARERRDSGARQTAGSSSDPDSEPPPVDPAPAGVPTLKGGGT